MESKYVIRKKKYSSQTSVVSMRMPIELIKKIDDICKPTNRTRNDVILKLLEFGFENCVIKDD